jgi:GNAT superfamily N-acetyltransferase
LSDAFGIRRAERTDVALLLAMIRELADYERAADQVTGTEQQLETALFGPQPAAEAVIALSRREPVGFALFYPTFSTWQCMRGLWLEDLYVRPHRRGAGVGRALLAHLAAVAVWRGYGRLEWSALHWNAPAIGFYERLGAQPLHEWEAFRLSGSELSRLAQESPPGR